MNSFLTGARRLMLAAVIVGVALPWGTSGATQLSKVVIVQTNAAGDDISLIDPATNRVVAEISGIEVNHGAAAAPDGSRFYVTNEVDHTLDIVDGRTLAVTHKVPLSGRPNNVAIRADGRRVYVAIVSGPGAVDVIDTASAKNVASITTPGGVHNTFMTPDSKFVVAGSIVGSNLTVIDAASERVLWTLPFDAGVRPIAFDTNSDGSTRRMFVQLSDFHGFAVVGFQERREVMDRVRLPEVPERERHTEYLQGSPSHGLGVTPDGRTLWLCSKVNSHVYAYSLPDLKYMGGVKVGSHPDWLTFSPDSRFVYVANAGSNTTSVVDAQKMTEVVQIPVGQVPKRVITAVVPASAAARWAAPSRVSPARTGGRPGAPAPAGDALDFAYFREHVEPIFVKKRDRTARCVVCHSIRTAFRLQPLPPGGARWTEEQSQLNYESAQRMAIRGNPLGSRLLTLPLSEHAGGNSFHPGGKHWTDQSDPEWQVLAAWVNGRR